MKLLQSAYSPHTPPHCTPPASTWQPSGRKPPKTLQGTPSINRCNVPLVRSTAERLGMDVRGAAATAIRLAVASIVRAIQLVSSECGRDPRDYALLPFDGAGPRAGG
ncbi:MAG: hydantoinase/oxoprolinase family protein [Janthinobacterium lividum]